MAAIRDATSNGMCLALLDGTLGPTIVSNSIGGLVLGGGFSRFTVTVSSGAIPRVLAVGIIAVQ
jgi:hypothetical protein